MKALTRDLWLVTRETPYYRGAGIFKRPHGLGAKMRRSRRGVFVAIRNCDVSHFQVLAVIFDFGVVAISFSFAYRGSTREYYSDSTAAARAENRFLRR